MGGLVVPFSPPPFFSCPGIGGTLVGGWRELGEEAWVEGIVVVVAKRNGGEASDSAITSR